MNTLDILSELPGGRPRLGEPPSTTTTTMMMKKKKLRLPDANDTSMASTCFVTPA